MEISAALALGRALLREHGLDEWRLVLDGAKTRAGVCRYRSREIGLSRPLTRLHDESMVRDTILHEIAHALVGPQHGHDVVWREMAVRIGCSGERLLEADAPRVRGDWVGTCPAGHEVSRHRRPSRVMSCSRCASGFSPHHILQWTYRGRDVGMSTAYRAELAGIRSRYGLAGDGVGAAPLAASATWRDEGLGRSADERPLVLGGEVVITSGGRLDGQVGVVEGVHSTRCQVRVAGELYLVPLGQLTRAARAARSG